MDPLAAFALGVVVGGIVVPIIAYLFLIIAIR